MKVLITALTCLVFTFFLAGNRDDHALGDPDCHPAGIPAVSWSDDSIGYRFITTRNSIDHLIGQFGDGYSQGESYLKQLDGLEDRYRSSEGIASSEEYETICRNLVKLQREALLNSPVIDFEEMLLVRRKVDLNNWGNLNRDVQSTRFGFPSNHECNTSLDRTGYSNDIVVLSDISGGAVFEPLYVPDDGGYVGEVDLHWDANRILFTQSDPVHWKLMEMDLRSGNVRQVSDMPDDVDCYDAAYLPDGRIVFGSSAPFQAVPCWHGLKLVSNLYQMNADGTGVRRLCFDQDHDLHPVVLENGQVLYNRWDYTGTSHPYLRQQMVMNPDGTGQRAIYGSNSWFPNALYFSRELPGRPGTLLSILAGYHGVRRMGQLVVVDTKKGWQEEDGLVGTFSGRGDRIVPEYKDRLLEGVWPMFTTPYPLDDHYFLVSCWNQNSSMVGIYLADVFDNLVLIKEVDGYALLEPLPLRRSKKPSVIPDKVRLDEMEATVYIHDVYSGPGLEGVPRGTISEIRVFSYNFGYPGMAGPNKIGDSGPFEATRIHGTARVEKDGSAMFRVPANTPVGFQTIDSTGAAVQLMRSWVSAMPGEYISCVGCHETPGEISPAQPALAALRQPERLSEWYGPVRGFDFEREVQPVLNHYCIECHNGRRGDIPDLRSETEFPGYKGQKLAHLGDIRLHRDLMDKTAGYVKYTPAYDALVPYIRRVCIEDDVTMLVPGELHARTSPLVQMLMKSHHGVQLDSESWERLYTWIDLNGPCHGTWKEVYPGIDDVISKVKPPSNKGRVGFQKDWNWIAKTPVYQRRLEMAKVYGGPFEDPEIVPEGLQVNLPPKLGREVHLPPNPRSEVKRKPPPVLNGWPMDSLRAKEKQNSMGITSTRIPLGVGIELKMVKIPSGTFLMGSSDGEGDERPLSIVHIEKAFWMAECEITNSQFRQFRPGHDCRYYARRHIRFDDRGIPLNGSEQPVVRVSWYDAMGFCRWLSEKTGMDFSLPTEAQWEYACRAGTGSDLSFGNEQVDFSQWANLGDRSFSVDVMHPNGFYLRQLDGLQLADTMFNDKYVVTSPAGSFRPNAWGLYDMHGNAAEWVETAYAPYPYTREGPAGYRVVRGGSFYDPPRRAGSAFRLSYPEWQKVFNVGFRVVASIE